MAHGKPSKQTKKFLKKQPTNKTEAPKIQKSYHNKSGKRKGANAARTAISQGAQGDVGEKKSTREGKRTLLDGMSMDEFLNTGEQGLAVDEMERMHLEGLGGLKEKDPSFYEFLKANDRELLEFDPDALEMEEEEEEEEEEEKGEVVEGGLTTEVLGRWEKLLSEEKSLGTLRKVLIAVKHAAANVTGDEKQTGNAKYILTDPSAFDKLLLLAYQKTPEVLSHHVPIHTKSGKPHLSSQNDKVSAIVPLLKSLFHSTLILLPNLSSPPTTLLVLKQTEKLVPYITSFRKMMKHLIVAILDIWARSVRTGDDDEEEDLKRVEESDAVKIAAFLWVRQVMLVGDRTLKEMVLKVAYAGFIKNSRVTTSRTLPHINFLKHSLSEIYGLDHSVTYPVAFPFIRQLAINLRNAMTTKTPQTQRIVYCWQYIHSLDFFSRTLSHHVQNKQSPLHPLLYPVIQIALGVVKLNPSAQFFPLRCYVVEGLLRLSRATETYIPLAPILLEPLDSALMRTRAAKKSVEKNVLKALELNVTLRVPTSYLSGPSSRVYHDQIAAHLTSLLYQFFDLYALNPAFPELVLPPVWNLKKWLKKHGGETSAKVRHGLQALVEKLDEQAKWVEEQRQGMAFSAENLVGSVPVLGGDEGPLRKAVKARRIDLESISG